MKYRGKYKRRVYGINTFMKEIDRLQQNKSIFQFYCLNTSIKLKINLSAGVPNRIYELGVLIT